VIKEKKVREMGNQVGLVYKRQPQDESVKWSGKHGDFMLDSDDPSTIGIPSSSHFSIIL
jgi:hypothetical protein